MELLGGGAHRHLARGDGRRRVGGGTREGAGAGVRRLPAGHRRRLLVPGHRRHRRGRRLAAQPAGCLPRGGPAPRGQVRRPLVGRRVPDRLDETLRGEVLATVHGHRQAVLCDPGQPRLVRRPGGVRRHLPRAGRGPGGHAPGWRSTTGSPAPPTGGSRSSSPRPRGSSSSTACRHSSSGRPSSSSRPTRSPSSPWTPGSPGAWTRRSGPGSPRRSGPRAARRRWRSSGIRSTPAASPPSATTRSSTPFTPCCASTTSRSSWPATPTTWSTTPSARPARRGRCTTSSTAAAAPT